MRALIYKDTELGNVAPKARVKETVAVRTNNPRSRIYGIGNRAILSREWRSDRAWSLRFVRSFFARFWIGDMA